MSHRIFGIPSREGALYLLVQLAAYGMDMGMFQLIVSLDPSKAALANVVGKGSSGLFSFLMHSHVTFAGEKQHSQGGQGLLYALALVANTIIGTAVLVGLVRLGLGKTVAKVLADGLLVILSFFVSRRVIFARRSLSSSSPRSRGRKGPDL